MYILEEKMKGKGKRKVPTKRGKEGTVLSGKEEGEYKLSWEGK